MIYTVRITYFLIINILLGEMGMLWFFELLLNTFFILFHYKNTRQTSIICDAIDHISSFLHQDNGLPLSISAVFFYKSILWMARFTIKGLLFLLTSITFSLPYLDICCLMWIQWQGNAFAIYDLYHSLKSLLI